MKISIRKSNLLQGINIVSKAVSNKTTHPILSCILVEAADWVLGKFPTEEYATLREANKKACEAVECILTDGIESGMNKYNG